MDGFIHRGPQGMRKSSVRRGPVKVLTGRVSDRTLQGVKSMVDWVLVNTQSCGKNAYLKSIGKDKAGDTSQVARLQSKVLNVMFALEEYD
jgi:hypothetical protein